MLTQPWHDDRKNITDIIISLDKVDSVTIIVSGSGLLLTTCICVVICLLVTAKSCYLFTNNQQSTL